MELLSGVLWMRLFCDEKMAKGEIVHRFIEFVSVHDVYRWHNAGLKYSKPTSRWLRNLDN